MEDSIDSAQPADKPSRPWFLWQEASGGFRISSRRPRNKDLAERTTAYACRADALAALACSKQLAKKQSWVNTLYNNDIVVDTVDSVIRFWEKASWTLKRHFVPSIPWFPPSSRVWGLTQDLELFGPANVSRALLGVGEFDIMELSYILYKPYSHPVESQHFPYNHVFATAKQAEQYKKRILHERGALDNA